MVVCTFQRLQIASLLSPCAHGEPLGDVRPHADLLARSLHSSPATLVAISKSLGCVEWFPRGVLRVPIPPETPQPGALSGATLSAVSLALKRSLGASNVQPSLRRRCASPRVSGPRPRPPLGAADLCPWWFVLLSWI